MRYVSTRGKTPSVGFAEALLTGLAPDGGLFAPAEWPVLSATDLRGLRGLSYPIVAHRVLRPFIGDLWSGADFATLLEYAYASFTHPAVCPLVQLDGDLWLMELFHGPSLSFKDIALQLLGRMFDVVSSRSGHRAIVLGATSGDTGSAAIEACRDCAALDIVILHPKERVSAIQRRQMTTVVAPNVHNLAIEGSFDDCQDIVKVLFSEPETCQHFNLLAVNSINWARIMAQTVYYVYAAVALGAPERSVSFAVPTGNFGNVFAAWAAGRMGVPIDRLTIGSNRNDILSRFFHANDMSVRIVRPTASPSMDIQISSNFERLLFEKADRDGARTASLMHTFRVTGAMPLDSALWNKVRVGFASLAVNDDETYAGIAETWRQTGRILDPHTAIGVRAGQAMRATGVGPVVCMATAHPAKFPEAITQAIGVQPELPPRLAGLRDLPERCTVLPPAIAAVRAYLEQVRKERDT